MTRIILPGGRTFKALWAADLPGTERWCAALPADCGFAEAAAGFEGADVIVTENAETGRRVHEGYTRLLSLRRTKEGLVIMLGRQKEGEASAFHS